MVVVPAVDAETTPPVPMNATDVLLLVHVPPAGVSVSVFVLPGQRGTLPVMGLGKAVTVTTAPTLAHVVE